MQSLLPTVLLVVVEHLQMFVPTTAAVVEVVVEVVSLGKKLLSPVPLTLLFVLL